MERHDRPVITLFAESEAFTSGARARLAGDAARHAHVRRVQRDDPVRLLDGNGRVAHGRLVAIGKEELTVLIDHVSQVPRPAPLEIMVPVADRDRMLLAAEKCAELQVTAWRPIHFARSRSVSPRGEGPRFREKVRARMRSALEQSGGAWMPDIEEEIEGIDALRAVRGEWKHFLLDRDGEPLSGLVTSVPTVLAVGPEGGLEQEELAAAADSGWVRVSLGPTTLRFETAVIAAVAVIRATQLTYRSS